MQKKIFGIAGLSGSGKSNLIELFQAEYGDLVTVIDLEVLGTRLMQFGGEGYRQIINYFGEDYLKKDGQLNLNKLWKFVYADHNKLKILDFMFAPLMADQVQKEIEMTSGIILVEGISFMAPAWMPIFAEKIWVENSPANILANLEQRKLPIKAEKYLDTQRRLYGEKSPQGYYLFNNSDSGQRENNWNELKKALMA